MLRKLAVAMIILFALTVLMMIVGCEGDQGPEGAAGLQGPQGDPGPTELNIVAVIKVTEDLKAFDMGHFAMSIYNAPSIPHVRFNNEDLAPDDAAMFEEGRLSYKEVFGLVGNDSAFIDISYTMMDGNEGNASSAISLPTEFVAIDNNVVIGFGDDAEFEWEVSDGADAYWIGFSCFLFYTDTAGTAQYNSLEFDTVLAANDTTLQALTSTIFPDTTEVMQIDSFGGRCNIRAVTGPWLPGEYNNFTGDAFGIFVGTTDSRFIDIDIPRKIPEKAVVGEDIPSNKANIDELFNQRITELSQNRTR